MFAFYFYVKILTSNIDINIVITVRSYGVKLGLN